MLDPTSAILWAQWRTLCRIRRSSGAGGLVLAGFAMFAWYGMWAIFAVLLGLFAVQPGNLRFLPYVLPNGLLAAFVYWQFTPLLTASLGASIDFRKLLVYPVPPQRLFTIEVLLRLSTSLEVVLVMSGLAAGLYFNPALRHEAVVPGFLLFFLFNLFLAAGLRNQLERWMARRRVREIVVLFVVLAAAAPQLIVVTGMPLPLRRLLMAQARMWWPWSATARVATSDAVVAGLAVLLLWTAAAWAFGRWQFERSLRFDAAAVESAAPRSGRFDRLYRLPGVLLADPLGAIVEKELRSLARSPRFRLVFMMSFTFGIIVFLPVMLGPGKRLAASPGDQLTMIGAYALLLLGDVAFWNILGFDRSAAQLYFLLPAPISRVFIGKNLAALIFVFLEITAIVLVWVLIRMPLVATKVAEAYAVALVFALYLLGAGNMSSVYYPRAVDPERSTGAASAGRLRAMLLLIFPAAAMPVLLAYGARYAFDSQAAFWSVLATVAVLGAAFYKVALDSALEEAERGKDRLLRSLSETEGPLRLT